MHGEDRFACVGHYQKVLLLLKEPLYLLIFVNHQQRFSYVFLFWLPLNRLLKQVLVALTRFRIKILIV